MQARRIAFLLAVMGVLGSLPVSVMAVEAGTTLDGTTDTLNDSTNNAVEDVQGHAETQTGAGVPSFNTTIGVAYSPITDDSSTCYSRYDSFFLEAFPPELDGYSSTLAYGVCYAPDSVRQEVSDQCANLVWATYGDGAQEQREDARQLLDDVCWDAIRNGDMDQGLGGSNACQTAENLGSLSVSGTTTTDLADNVLGLMVAAQGTPCETLLSYGLDADAHAGADVTQVDSDTVRLRYWSNARGGTAGTWVLHAQGKVLTTSTLESTWSLVSGSERSMTCWFNVTATDTTGSSCGVRGDPVDLTVSNDVVYKWKVSYTLTWVDATGATHRVQSGTEGGYV